MTFKLSTLKAASFDNTTKVLTFSGVDENGGEAVAEVSVSEPSQTFAWLFTLLTENSDSKEFPRTGAIASGLSIALAGESDENSNLAFIFSLGGKRFTVAVPVFGVSDERLQAIKDAATVLQSICHQTARTTRQ